MVGTQTPGPEQRLTKLLPGYLEAKGVETDPVALQGAEEIVRVDEVVQGEQPLVRELPRQRVNEAGLARSVGACKHAQTFGAVVGHRCSPPGVHFAGSTARS